MTIGRVCRTFVLPLSLSLAATLAACGGIAPVSNGGPDPSGRASGGAGPSASSSSMTPPDAPSVPAPHKPSEPFGPSTEAIATTDVSILYPLPTDATLDDFVPAGASGAHGVLLPRAAFDAVAVVAPTLDGGQPGSALYDALRLVSLRLDPCSSRNTTASGECRSEVRLVFQQLLMAPPGGAPSGPTAADGALHVVYDVQASELDAMVDEILALKSQNGGLALLELAPHPILVEQGLKGGFAAGLRAFLLAHLGDERVARVTFFDHRNPEIDSWSFGVFDRDTSVPMGPFVARPIPNVGNTLETVSGSSAVTSTLPTSFASLDLPPPAHDDLTALLGGERTTPPPMVAPLQLALDRSLALENPTLRNVQNTDCASCHLAEGAHRIGAGVFGLSTASEFTHPRSLARVDQRTSVTNLHAFGYLGREVSIMQRTANESVLVAERFTARRLK